MSGDPFWHVIRAQKLELPDAVLALHSGHGTKRYQGQCDITRGKGILARLALRLAGFPPEGENVPTSVTITTDQRGSEWRRDFGGHVTLSRLSCNSAKDRVFERFGIIRLVLALEAQDERLSMSVASVRVLGVPLSKVFVPVSDTTESEDEDGAFRFDVSARAPGIGFLIRYAGVLRPV